jgi:arylsulfatase A-like enzyme
MIVRAPGAAKPGTRVDSMVSGVDVLPTVLELMDLPKVNGVHGRSLVPLWRGAESKAHDAIFSGQDYEGATRLVMMRTPEWKFTRYDEGGTELYNTVEDPDELHNRAGESKYAGVLSRMATTELNCAA